MSDEYNESSAPRPRRSFSQDGYVSRDDFASLAERVTVVETRQRIHERQVSRDMEGLEKRLAEDLQRMEKTEVELVRTLNEVKLAIAELKVRSGLIGAISSGVTVALLVGFEWLRNKAQGQ